MKPTTSRRYFLKVSALSGGGMLINFSFVSQLAQAKENWNVAFMPNGYIKIAVDGTIVLLTPNPEIGQGVKTSLPVIVAEELCLDWKRIQMEICTG
ncbi:MAG: molybdopterin-dependent oxidoreductase [Saprospiraceae bacterium]|nr:molybdopterin-dependent oxidoreductase [Saprospiraceae bacterium]